MTGGLPRLAVLGATGCLGQHITAVAKAAGHHVVGIARRESAALVADRFAAVDLSAADTSALAAVLTEERVDVVVNAVGGWGQTPAEAHAGNVKPVEHLLACLRGLDPAPRLVQLGTIHEYGPVPEGQSIREDTEERPESVYARAKLSASRLVLAAIRDGGVRGVVLRVANTCGPGPSPVGFLGSLVARLSTLAPGNRLEIPVASDRRDYVDLRDVADAVLRAACSPLADPLVNVGTGEAVDLRVLVRALIATTGLPEGTVLAREQRVESLGGSWTRFDIGRARERLGWQPRHGLEESVRAMWASAAPIGS